MIRVLVAEDSITARLLLVEMLRSDPGIAVVGEASNGEEAVELVRTLHPDVVSMDIQMPRLGGFEATKRIMAADPTPIVIVSSLDTKDVKISLEALRAGALAAVAKPAGPGSPRHDEESQQLLTTIKAMAGVRLIRRLPATARTSRLPPSGTPSGVTRTLRNRPIAGGARIVAIAASTGGPGALQRILSALPADFPAPIVVVQHIALGFAKGLAGWLDDSSRLAVKIAGNADPLEPGTVYIAPDACHLTVRPGPRVSLSDSPPVNGFRPSANVLFESAAQVFRERALGVILTGMGSDGVDGLRILADAGGRVIAQDEATSDIFGMPAAAIDAGIADAVLPLPEVAGMLERAVAPDDRDGNG